MRVLSIIVRGDRPSWLWRCIAAPLLILSLATILPAHRHGNHDADASRAMGELAGAQPHDHHDHSSGDSRDDADCVICHLVHSFGFTPPLDSGLSHFTLVVQIRVLTAEVAPTLDQPQPYLSRGPPRA